MFLYPVSLNRQKICHWKMGSKYVRWNIVQCQFVFFLIVGKLNIDKFLLHSFAKIRDFEFGKFIMGCSECYAYYEKLKWKKISK